MDNYCSHQDPGKPVYKLAMGQAGAGTALCCEQCCSVPPQRHLEPAAIHALQKAVTVIVAYKGNG